jgi:hypothetical protein
MMGSACAGACLLERSRAGGQDTRVDLLRALLHRLDPRAPSAAPGPGLPSESLARIRGALPPLEHLLHECIINLMYV